MVSRWLSLESADVKYTTFSDASWAAHDEFFLLWGQAWKINDVEPQGHSRANLVNIIDYLTGGPLPGQFLATAWVALLLWSCSDQFPEVLHQFLSDIGTFQPHDALLRTAVAE